MITNKLKLKSDDLPILFDRYLEHMKTQFFEKPELIKSGERVGEVVYIKIPSPLDIFTFCDFIGINQEMFHRFINKDFDDIESEINTIEEKTCISSFFVRVRDYIRSKQVAGGVSGIYNPMLVARINGIKDTIEQQNVGKTTDINISIAGTDVDITD